MLNRNSYAYIKNQILTDKKLTSDDFVVIKNEVFSSIDALLDDLLYTMIEKMPLNEVDDATLEIRRNNISWILSQFKKRYTLHLPDGTRKIYTSIIHSEMMRKASQVGNLWFLKLLLEKNNNDGTPIKDYIQDWQKTGWANCINAAIFSQSEYPEDSEDIEDSEDLEDSAQSDPS